MADELATIAALEGSLKEDYLGVINEQWSTDSVLDSMIENDSENIEGLEGVMSLSLNPNVGIGYVAEDGYLPDAGYPVIKKVRLSLAYMYGSFQLSGQLMNASQSTKGSWAPALTTIMEDLVKGMKKVRNFYNFGDGSGAIARVVSVAGGGLTVVVDRYSPLFEDPRAMDSYTAKDGTGTRNMNGVKISSFARSTLTITFAATSTVTAGDYLYMKGCRNVAQMGLLGGVDNGTYVATFQGLARSSYARWNSYVFHNSGAPRNLTENLMNGAQAAARMQDSAIDLWIGTPFQLNDLVEDMQLLRQFVNVKKYQGGIRAVDMGGYAFTEDPDAIPGYTWGLSKKSLSFFTAPGGLNWLKEPGANNILQRVITSSGRKDAFEATLRLYRQLGFRRCNNCVRMEDIAENTPTGY
jgi:hypothetical protein